MKNNKTRKQRKGVQTIPQLRKAFDHIEDVAKRGVSLSDFQAEWKKTFHHELDDAAGMAFLTFHKKSKGKTKKMRGGAAPLAGAPLDYTTRPGTYETPYGSFLDYIGSGFSFYDKINTNSIVPTQCGKENITPQLAADMGSNQVGGSANKKTQTRRKQKGGFPSLSEFATALSFRPITATVPTSPLHDAQMGWKGQPLPASPSVSEGTPPYREYPPTVSNYPAYPINRGLGNEIRS